MWAVGENGPLFYSAVIAFKTTSFSLNVYWLKHVRTIIKRPGLTYNRKVWAAILEKSVCVHSAVKVNNGAISAL